MDFAYSIFTGFHLITATCNKVRQLQRKITPVVTADPEVVRNNQRRRHRAKLSYSLTMAATIVANVTILAEEVIWMSVRGI